MFKGFFVHKHHKPGHVPSKFARGLTVLFRPYEDTGVQKGPDYVVVSATFCSPKDEFCKRVGRDEALKAEYKVIHKKQVPDLMVQLTDQTGIKTTKRDWYYLHQHML